MYLAADHFSDATRCHIKNQVDLQTDLGHRLVDCAEQFIFFQSRAMQAFLHDIKDFASHMLFARGTQEVASLTLTELQTAIKNTVAYSCHTASMVTGAMSELVEICATQHSEINHQAIELLMDVSRCMSSKWNNLVDTSRSIFDHANASYERYAQTVKQVLDLMETGFINAGRQFATAATQSLPTTSSMMHT